jgi:hypothetical protein
MRRTGKGINLAIVMNAFTAMTVRSFPPCGGEPERGLSPEFGVRGLPLSLASRASFARLGRRKGGGNATAFAERYVVESGSIA